MRIPALTVLLTGTVVLAFAGESPAPAPTVRRDRPAPVLSPQIDADSRVTFRTRAPNAQEVLVNGQWQSGNRKLKKAENGVWTVTLGPLPPGVYEYSFLLDGVRMIDPGNPAIKPMRQPRTSILHLPGNPPLVHDFQDVPHGTVRLHAYHSRSLNRVRDLAVYTPPGYDHHPDLLYPVLILQHGSGDNEATWTVHGKAHWILDNLIAAGRAKPMLVVMLDGHALAPGLEAPGFESNTEAFESDLIHDVLPFVERHYRTRPGSENRGIVGLSMGGGQSLTIGLRHAAHFAWVGGFSSATPSEEALSSLLADIPSLNRQLQLLWIACGKNDFLLQRNERFVSLLQDKGLNHEWHLTDGDHSWPVWRVYLAEFAPRLFEN